VKPSAIRLETPVVYLHGAFSTASAWRGILQARTHNLPTIVPTLPGLAVAPTPSMARDYDLDKEVDHLADIIKVETSEPVHLVGHSYGGLVAYAAALSGRVDIRACTLFEPLTLDLLKQTGDAGVLAELTDFLDCYQATHEAGDLWAVRQVIDLWGGAGFLESLPERIQLSMASMTGFNIQQWAANRAFTPSLEKIQAMTIPITLVHGEKTHPVCKLVNERLHELLPNSRLVEVGDASHFLIQSHSDTCAAIIDQDVGASS
jgi:pimeloyl-ACP methyl ester carboxylesterase